METKDELEAEDIGTQENALYVPFLGLALGLAAAALILGHLVMFLAYYAGTLAPTTLPYFEQFIDAERLDYRQYGGAWTIEDQALVQSETNLADLYAVLPNLTVEPETAYYFSTNMRIRTGPKGGGLLFNLQTPDEIEGSHLIRFGSDNGLDYLVYGHFDKVNGVRTFVAQGSLTPEIGDEVDLGVAVHDGVYDIFVNENQVAAGIPLVYEGGYLALTTWFSSVIFDDIYAASAVPSLPTALGGPAVVPPAQSAPETAEPSVVPVAEVVEAVEEAGVVQEIPGLPALGNMLQLIVSDDAGTAADPFGDVGALNRYFSGTFTADTDQSQWRALAGDWRLGSEGLVQLNTRAFDNTIVHAGQFSDFTLRTRLQHLDGVGGGVVFSIPPGSTAKSGHMIRYMEDGILAWGYFDEQGVFQGQGAADVPAASDDIHTLVVAVGSDSYDITLDDVPVAVDVPLVINEGRIGLTASRSVVAFKEAAIIALDISAAASADASQIISDTISKTIEVEINP